MKLPRDLSGTDLAHKLEVFGCSLDRQTGSHIRLTSNVNKTEHHVTIPVHDPLKVGTLNAILAEVARYLQIDRKSLVRELFK